MHSPDKVGTLYVVATPIGNLEDITLRALKVLKEVDIIACEDTRRTLKLLNYYEITGKKLISYHEHNEREQAKRIVKELLRGKNVALVSDAGTPCISDPGYRLVNLARKESINVIPIPGATAFATALSASGLPTDRFLFTGFLPRKEKQLKETLKELLSLPFTVVCYESPHRLKKTLEIIAAVEPEREIGIYREITKVNEEFLYGKAQDLLKELERKDTIKGEFVLLFPPRKEERSEEEKDPESFLKELKEKGYTLKEAVKETCQKTGFPRNEVYRIALKLFRD
ncbi:16S rRNA (cytidine(1402)-2'-O)-methyltransferase [Phorcysia thermohydrogeniphila]|uniref:Ribosomal RNA small subunit methyltransferase I n=1 Tax=Phorcysia thermohydrogeniphila TaxID=936138 RepID=A0A4R1GGM7_9BACT|nr:16S rRNA (cytidine(1402)-2'-O)-methyltransferase [Phorcysia thermohydrogeniphila]TCK03302.1 16S rRNA (cytidine1402-2'-O)-methyltransferase [Phorcysia thermohydrogeniphila]